MLRPECNEIVDGGRVIPLNICAEELSSLREPDRVKPVLEFCNVCNLLSDKVDLFVHVSKLWCVGE